MTDYRKPNGEKNRNPDQNPSGASDKLKFAVVRQQRHKDTYALPLIAIMFHFFFRGMTNAGRGEMPIKLFLTYNLGFAFFKNSSTSLRVGMPALPPIFLHFIAATALENSAVFLKSQFRRIP